MRARLTQHARKRLIERTSLEEYVLLGMLDTFCTAGAGHEPHTSRWHRLFYSSPDDRHFVAIQDMTNGEVITILPLDYHQNLAWKVSQKKLNKAMRLAAPQRYAALSCPAPAEGTTFQIVGIFWKPDMTRLTKGLGTFRFTSIPASGEEAAENDALVGTIFARMRQKNLDALDVDDIVLSAAEEGLYYKLPWEQIASFSLASDRAPDGTEMTGTEEEADAQETSDFEELCLAGSQN